MPGRPGPRYTYSPRLVPSLNRTVTSAARVHPQLLYKLAAAARPTATSRMGTARGQLPHQRRPAAASGPPRLAARAAIRTIDEL